MDLAQDICLTQKDWDAFHRGYSPFRFGEVVDRDDLGFPSWFMPNARGAVVPSAQVLKPISSRRVRFGFWSEIMPDVFREGRGQWAHITRALGTLCSLAPRASNTRDENSLQHITRPNNPPESPTRHTR